MPLQRPASSALGWAALLLGTCVSTAWAGSSAHFGHVDAYSSSIELFGDEATPVLELSLSLYQGSQLLHEATLAAPAASPVALVSLVPQGIDGLPDGDYTEVLQLRLPATAGEVAVIDSASLALVIEQGEMVELAGAAAQTSMDEAAASLSEPATAATRIFAAASTPNLRNEGISHAASCGSNNYCSVVFYNTICNRGTATVWSHVTGMKGWGTPQISTCTGLWQAFDTAGSLAPGACASILVYGPGFVGSQVRKGSYLTVTGYADIYCNVAESSESDNSRTQTIRVGY